MSPHLLQLGLGLDALGFGFVRVKHAVAHELRRRQQSGSRVRGGSAHENTALTQSRRACTRKHRSRRRRTRARGAHRVDLLELLAEVGTRRVQRVQRPVAHFPTAPKMRCQLTGNRTRYE